MPMASRVVLLLTPFLAAFGLSSVNKVVDRSQQAQPYEESVLGTIGTFADVGGMEASAVRGYGLVVGLENRGSADCPPAVRTYLNQEMNCART